MGVKIVNVGKKNGQGDSWNRGVYSSLFQYNHTDKKLPFLTYFIKKRSI